MGNTISICEIFLPSIVSFIMCSVTWTYSGIQFLSHPDVPFRSVGFRRFDYNPIPYNQNESICSDF